MKLPPQTRLGPYEIVGPIDAGGMGEVYRARDTRLDRTVAVKVCAEQFSERFEREARAIAALNHTYICTLHDVGPNYLVMEYVEGPTLGERIAEGAIPIGEAIRLARQLAEALEAAHEKGIVHCDLKPGNIKLTADDNVKVLDFGLAALSLPADAPNTDLENSPTRTLSLTRAGIILGTAGYMAPEQARGTALDKRADIWAFGVVVYEMLTGRRLFAGETVSDTLAAVLKTDPDWNALPPETPASLRKLLRRCLERDRKRRLRDIGDALAELDEAHAERSTPPAPTVEQRRRWWIPVAAAAAALAIGGAWGVAWWRGSPTGVDSLLRLDVAPPEGGQFVFGLGLAPGGMAISPDGRNLAYIAVGNGKAGLWVQSLESGAARLLPDTESASDPFWSPDSKALAYFGGGRLQRVDLAGGSPLKICDLPNSGAGGSWSGDGTILVGMLGFGILRVPAAGGSPTVLTKHQGYFPQVLPGGRFLYWSNPGKPADKGVYVASFGNPEGATHLLTSDANALYVSTAGKNYLLMMQGTTLLAQELDLGTLQLVGERSRVADPVATVPPVGRMNVAASATGLVVYGVPPATNQFEWLDRSGRLLATVGEPGYYPSFRLSPSGTRVAATLVRNGLSALWLLETGRGVATPATNHSGPDAYPVWSPNEQEMVFSTAIPPALFRKRLNDTGSEERLTQPVNTFHLGTDWSRDGRFVSYFEFGPETQEDMWYFRVPPEGRAPAPEEIKPYLRTRFRECNLRFSPEPSAEAGPRWVAYQSDESGRPEIYINSFPEPGRKVRVSIRGGQFPEWGPLSAKQERELFYLSPDNKLMSATLRMNADSVEPSPPVELFAVQADVTTWSPFQVAADGQRFLVRATSQRGARPLTVLVNWGAALQGKAAGK